jgi:hypothetical protein
MSAFIANPELSQKDIWDEIEWRAESIGDTLNHVISTCDPNPNLGVIMLTENTFSELQALINMIKPPLGEREKTPDA